MSLSPNLSPFHSIFGLTKQVSLVSSPECQDWWAAGCRQNASALPANCTVCSAVKSLQIVTDFRELSEKLQRHQPFLIKVMQGFVKLGDESKLLNSTSPKPLPSIFTHELRLLIQDMCLRGHFTPVWRCGRRELPVLFLWLMIFVFGPLAIYVAVNLGCFLVGGKREQGATPGAQLLSLFYAL